MRDGRGRLVVKIKCSCGEEALISSRLCASCTYRMEYPWASEEAVKPPVGMKRGGRPKQKETLDDAMAESA